MMERANRVQKHQFHGKAKMVFEISGYGINMDKQRHSWGKGREHIFGSSEIGPFCPKQCGSNAHM